MDVKLTIETDEQSGKVNLYVNGVRRHYSEFLASWPEVTDFCATRNAIEFLRDIHREAAERSVGHRTIDVLRRLHDRVVSDMSYQLKHNEWLARDVEIAKRLLDDSTKS